MFFVIKVVEFNGPNAKADKNGNTPVYLESLNGTLPERARVLAGTIAKQRGFEVGNIYSVIVTDMGQGDYGTIYQHKNIGQISTIEYMTNVNKFPAGQVQIERKASATSKSEVPALAEVGDDDADF